MQNPLTRNQYVYVLNNPVNYIDPSGKFFKELWNGAKKMAKKAANWVKKQFNKAADTVKGWFDGGNFFWWRQ